MLAHNRLTQEAISYFNPENAVQYESNIALQENRSVNLLHVELQEQRVANFQPKAESERNMSGLENAYMMATKSRDGTIAEMDEMKYNHVAELAQMNHRCEANEHELLNVHILEICLMPTKGWNDVSMISKNYKTLVPIEMRHCGQLNQELEL